MENKNKYTIIKLKKMNILSHLERSYINNEKLKKLIIEKTIIN